MYLLTSPHALGRDHDISQPLSTCPSYLKSGQIPKKMGLSRNGVWFGYGFGLAIGNYEVSWGRENHKKRHLVGNHRATVDVMLGAAQIIIIHIQNVV
jgi:hypothetical protein